MPNSSMLVSASILELQLTRTIAELVANNSLLELDGDIRSNESVCAKQTWQYR